ncbi:YdgH/BhsA/McbA-like domain containing protein, partial [Escherichia coli]|uniref:YdgH/BhsA/McbA-like domain containing protein n=1 Tax=Escherichia coli TaxID=562 RepID=UPI00201CBDC4
TDGDGSHGSTSKTPSYTKSVSWHHYPVLEDAIADIARKYNASSWKVTSMRIDNNSTATAVLYK